MWRSMFKKWCKASAYDERHKQFNDESEKFDLSLDWVWISKSIGQLKEAIQMIMNETPKFKGNKIPSWYSVRERRSESDESKESIDNNIFKFGHKTKMKNDRFSSNCIQNLNESSNVLLPGAKFLTFRNPQKGMLSSNNFTKIVPLEVLKTKPHQLNERIANYSINDPSVL